MRSDLRCFYILYAARYIQAHDQPVLMVRVSSYHHPLLLDFFLQFCNHAKYLEISTFSWIFWISHESCISSGCFRTVQMVVLRLKVFSCELSTTRIMLVFELVYLQNPLQMTRFWLPANCETRVLMALRQHFLQMVLGQLGQVACRNHDKFIQIPCQAAVTVLLEPKRKDFLEMMVTCPESDQVSGGGLFRNYELGVPAWSQLFFRVLSFVVRENQ